jgi:hypothetical protein
VLQAFTIAVCLPQIPNIIQLNIRQENLIANEGYIDPIGELSWETRDMHRAITSLMEELEAVDWYNQRADACKNRDEGKEHAVMVLEWIRRRDTTLDKELKDCLFSGKKIGH